MITPYHAKTAFGSLVAGPWTPGQKVQIRVNVTPPVIGNGILAGQVRCSARASDNAAGAHVRARLEVYVVSGDGLTVRGVALAQGDYSPGADFNPTTLRNKIWADGDALSSVGYFDGDRFVIVQAATDASGSSPQATVEFGDNSGTDILPADETGISQSNPWVEFSQNYAFYTTNVRNIASGTFGAVTATATSSQTPSSLALQVLEVAQFGASAKTATVPTVTGCGLTWVQIATVRSPGSSSRITAFRAMGDFPTTGTLTIDFAGNTQQQGEWAWKEYTNVATSGTNGSDAIVQSQTFSGSGSAGTGFTFNLPSAGSNPENAVQMGFTNESSLPVLTTRSGWALQQSPNTGGTFINSYYRPNFEQTAGVVFAAGGGSVPVAAIALEIKTLPAPHAPTITLVTPANLSTIATTDSITIDVTDVDGDLTGVQLAWNGGDIYSAGAFQAGFLSSTKTTIGNGFRFVITPTAWPAGALSIIAGAGDSLGNHAPLTVFHFTVTAPATHAPVITLVSPANGSGIGPSDAITMDVTDVDGDLATFSGTFTLAGIDESAHSPTDLGAPGFGSHYSALSTAVTITNGRRYTFLRSGGWPSTTLVFNGFATDALGNSTPATFSWTVSFPAPPAPPSGPTTTPTPSERGRDIEIAALTNNFVLANGDLSIIAGVPSIVQAIRQKVRAVLGEWFLDETVGVDWYDSIFVKNPDLSAIGAILRAAIAGVPGVVDIQTFSATLDKVHRALSVSFTATDDTGELVVDSFQVT